MTLPWYPRDMGKYARDTGHLTMLEHGAYNLMLDHYYSTGGLPQAVIHTSSNASSNATLLPDHSRIYRVCKAMNKAEQDAVDSVLKMFFKLDRQGFYRQAKADEVIETQEQKHQNRVESGRKGGSSKASSNATSNTPQTKKETKKESPLPPRGGSVLALPIREGGVFNIDLYLKDADREAAKANAPGWDMNGYLIPTYNEAINSGERERPDKPAAAFIGWCKHYTKGRKP